MNLLRFLTGVEWSRMGEHGITFKPILQGLTELNETQNQRKQAAVKLIFLVNAQIQGAIRQEAVSRTQQATEALRAAVREGVSLTEKLNALVVQLGPQGRGFSLISRETAKGISSAREAEAVLSRLSDEMNDMDNSAVKTVLTSLKEAAFQMNLNAFNAAVESARSGDREECAACAKGVRDYAWLLHTTYTANNDFMGEAAKLMSLLCADDGKIQAHGFQKQLDDIVFQAELLNTQLSLESERASREDFLTLADEFAKTLKNLKQDNPQDEQKISVLLKSYSGNLSTLIERGKAVANNAGDHGVGIMYIINEFDLFVVRLNEYLTA
jgi:hypothetical protein